MTNVQVYTKDWCSYSARAKALLDSKGVRFEEIDVTYDRERELEMIRRSGGHTVPQIFIGGHLIGGSDDLVDLETSGGLDVLLSGQAA